MKISEILTEAKATKQRLDPKCWKGYKKQGTKVKDGVRVNNCVKEELEEATVNPQLIISLVTKILATEARRMTNAPIAQLLAPLMKEYNLTLQQINSMVPGGLKKAAAEYGVMVKTPDVSEDLHQEFDMIESIVEHIADQHAIDPELVWEDLATLSDDELYVFAFTQETVLEDWQKVNKKDKTDGMSRKAVKAYRRENPGSKLKTAVTTKPSKLKKGSKASKRRSSYCSRSAGQKKMHNIDCSKTPDKAICKARRRWNC